MIGHINHWPVFSILDSVTSAASTTTREDKQTPVYEVTLIGNDTVLIPDRVCDGEHGKFMLISKEAGVSVPNRFACFERRSPIECASLCLQLVASCNVFQYSEITNECCTLVARQFQYVKRDRVQLYCLMACPSEYGV